MRFLPLGGAHEVGASCSLVELGPYRFLIDAGIRMGAKEGDQLPDLSRIQEEAGRIDAILLTHAHMDHSGALPLVHLAFPEVPIYMTPGTLALVRILLLDALKIMASQFEREGEIPLYPPAAVESCMGRIRPVQFDYPLALVPDEVGVSFHPAGHILGAAAISLTSRYGNMLLSGDISVSAQRTLPGMLVPRVRPDVVVVESTYGGRLHAHRPTQESNLVQTVTEAIESQGKVVIPAFAVGRAQEVILLLRRAMERKQIPFFPVYVDGMVRAVCAAYSQFPQELQPTLRRWLQKGRDIFFPEKGTIYRVHSPKERQGIIEGPPACIISSSGMMSGGPSTLYAAALAHEARNLITITGYQDEEAPGRRLLELAEAPAEERPRLRVADREIDVRCRVEKYALSAHADSGEIAGLIGRLSPGRGVVLVHGDHNARPALSRLLDSVVGCQVHLPQNGEALDFTIGRKSFSLATSFKRKTALGSEENILTAETLPQLHQALWAEAGRKGLYRLADLYARWYGAEKVPSPQELDELRQLLEEDQLLFEPDYKRGSLFRLRPPEEIENVQALAAAHDPAQGGVLEVNEALLKASEIFPSETGLYKKGARQDEHILILSFTYPLVARQQYKEPLERLRQETGWKIELNERPHQASLEERAVSLLPQDWTLAKNPSTHHEGQEVRLKVHSPEGKLPRDTVAQLQERFLKETGYSLSLSLASKAAVPSSSRRDAEGRMEINQTYQRIEQVFASCPHKPYKKSKKGERIVLAFLSPFIGEKYQKEMEALSEETGWEMALHPEPNQHAIKQLVQGLIPASWGLHKEPGFFKEEGKVRVRLLSPPSPEEFARVAQDVHDNSGFDLEMA